VELTTRAALAIGLTFLLPSQPSGNERHVRQLKSGDVVERALAIGQSHVYELTIAAGQYIQITIDQRGIDIAASLVAPNGKAALALDAMDDAFRPETVAAIAEVDGPYLLRVEPGSVASGEGRYAVRIDATRPAGPGDTLRVDAERAFARGRSVRNRNQAPALEDALAAFRAARDRYRDLGDVAGEMKATIEIGATEYYLSRPDAVATAQQAERLARDLNDRPAVARALRLLGNVLIARGDYAGALRAIDEAGALSRAIGDRRGEIRSLNEAGRIHDRSGASDRAIRLYEQGLSLARSVGFREMQVGFLNNLGIAFKKLGDYDAAHRAYEQCLALSREVNDVRGIWILLTNLGTLSRRLGDHDKALAYTAEALSLARESGNRQTEARALGALAIIHHEQGRLRTALEQHRESLAMRREIGDLSGQSIVWISIGRVLHDLRKPEDALAAFDEALKVSRSIGERPTERDALLNLAWLKADVGRLPEAVADIQAAVDLDEKLRTEITSPELRASFVASEQPTYQTLINLLQRQHAASPDAGFDARALEASERARARVLLDSLLDAHVVVREGVEATLLEREQALQKQLNDASQRLSGQLARNAGETQTAAASDKIQRLDTALQRVQDEIRRHSPRYATLTQPQPLAASAIQQNVLDADTVMLEYALSPSRSWLWAVTQDSITSIELPAQVAIESAVRSLHGAFTARRRQPRETAAAYARRVQAADVRLAQERVAVSRMLLGGIAKQLREEWNGKRLAIVATGVLEYVPFAALVTPDALSGRPLAARHEIVHVPSASVLAALRRETTGRLPAQRALAIIADPVFEVADPRVSAVARPRGTAGAGAAVVRAGHRTRTGDRGDLGRLPFSREEAAAIVSLVPRRDVFTAVDFKASRATVMAGALAGHRVVHFATHGFFDAGSPALSGLVLSLVNERGEPQDGFLRLNDIYNMRLDADLVVLSACRTALGKEIKGEGLVGLARAFMYAGAPRVVASLWQVSDFATAELMKKFYRGVLTEGLRPAAALRAAQLEMSRDPRWKAPYYWAGFVLQGDWK